MAAATSSRLLDALETVARTLVDRLDADACTVSRRLGDVLLVVTDVAPPGETLVLGGGFIVSEYPETQRVLETGEPSALHLGLPGADKGESRLLRELGYSSLLMLRLAFSGEPWGLVEVYRKEPRPFGAAEQRAAAAILATLGQ